MIPRQSDKYPTFPRLTTDRLLLREFAWEDSADVFEIYRREDVNIWMETEPMQSISDAEERVRGRINLFKDGMGFRWAITLKNNPGRVIGSCGYFSVRRGTQTVETGYELHPDHWGRGLISEALREMIKYSFSENALMPVHRIEALVEPGNLGSIRVLEKLGFSREGIRREFGYWKGCYQDVILFALLNSHSTGP
jgi:ribosomal-protein-alanine N-acetyltransferase